MFLKKLYGLSDERLSSTQTDMAFKYFLDLDPESPIIDLSHEMDQELAYSKFKEKDYELLDKIREMRNYWCHQCYIDLLA